jgi:transcriptional regulator with XRE-family HTH domain
MTNTIELKKRIDESGLKYQHIANKLGLSDYGLSKKINNVSEFKASEIYSLCEILQIKTSAEKERIFFNQNVD